MPVSEPARTLRRHANATKLVFGEPKVDSRPPKGEFHGDNDPRTAAAALTPPLHSGA